MENSKTYSEVQDEEPINWNNRLDRAINEEITPQEKCKWYEQSSSWVTCACGNLCSIIPRSRLGVPMDYILEALGLDFCAYIEFEDWAEAKKTLFKIELRSDELIKELTNH